MQQISELTPQQEALLDEYKRKWQLAALSTGTIDKQKTTQAIEAVYKQISKVEEFDIYFFESPVGIADLSFLNCLYPNENWCNSRKLNNLIRQFENQLLRKGFLRDNFWRHITSPLIEAVGSQVDIQLWHYLEKRLSFWSPLSSLIPVKLGGSEQSSLIWKSAKPNQQRRLEGLWFLLTTGLVSPDGECSVCCLLDYCVTELQCSAPEHLWHILKTFVADCGWTFLFQDFCLTCNRPYQVILDDQNKPHSENEAAIQFLDGFSVLAKHGTSVPQL
ncbi:hypothetical protein [Pantanalinema sp. GBBB05]|uniref:hypothetical protein n=1 Tax=Pantanalinema sp. GBBB05 TaxID=2604139 RepID=UPI001D26BD2F|nr:hypothetical protein [Pantanalinema sp. GBBB05]